MNKITLINMVATIDDADPPKRITMGVYRGKYYAGKAYFDDKFNFRRRRRMLMLYLAWLRRFEDPSERDKFLRDRFRTKEK